MNKSREVCSFKFMVTWVLVVDVLQVYDPIITLGQGEH